MVSNKEVLSAKLTKLRNTFKSLKCSFFNLHMKIEVTSNNKRKQISKIDCITLQKVTENKKVDLEMTEILSFDTFDILDFLFYYSKLI